MPRTRIPITLGDWQVLTEAVTPETRQGRAYLEHAHAKLEGFLAEVLRLTAERADHQAKKQEATRQINEIVEEGRRLRLQPAAGAEGGARAGERAAGPFRHPTVPRQEIQKAEDPRQEEARGDRRREPGIVRTPRNLVLSTGGSVTLPRFSMTPDPEIVTLPRFPKRRTEGSVTLPRFSKPSTGGSVMLPQFRGTLNLGHVTLPQCPETLNAGSVTLPRFPDRGTWGASCSLGFPDRPTEGASRSLDSQAVERGEHHAPPGFEPSNRGSATLPGVSGTANHCALISSLRFGPRPGSTEESAR